MATLCMKNIEQTQKKQEGKQRKNIHCDFWFYGF